MEVLREPDESYFVFRVLGQKPDWSGLRMRKQTEHHNS